MEAITSNPPEQETVEAANAVNNSSGIAIEEVPVTSNLAPGLDHLETGASPQEDALLPSQHETPASPISNVNEDGQEDLNQPLEP